MEETIGKASLRDAQSEPGSLSTRCSRRRDKTPVLQIANIVLPTAENENERERRERHAKLDTIARKLMESREPSA